MIGQIFQPITEKVEKRGSTRSFWELVHLEHGRHLPSYMVVWRAFYSYNALVKVLKDIWKSLGSKEASIFVHYFLFCESFWAEV